MENSRQLLRWSKYSVVFLLFVIILSCNRHVAIGGEKRSLLEQIKKSIDENDKRSGYMQMQEYEAKYITNEDWINNKVNYLDYNSINEIKEALSKSMKDGDFAKTYFLYKLILPEL